ncbi:hypothetical protein BT96DRAFT_1003739 [Gymnopus androsaceus JB14]|uniref:Uncharacterized protein n=1 Tax=Gymnopus androsaceus JB14 TaxID=1447944 RepID=A0A6A4GU56_9AGAR|nr:hypothetical protein BT96DRAFT_1003739 [Gymnopus androsaceus JB14]
MTSNRTSRLLPSPLPSTAYHLAAQVPEMWVSSSSGSLSSASAHSKKNEVNDMEELTPTASASASLAVRKVVWRALLERILADHSHSSSGSSEPDSQVKVATRPGFILPMEANAYLACLGNTRVDEKQLGGLEINGESEGIGARVGKLQNELGLGEESVVSLPAQIGDSFAFPTPTITSPPYDSPSSAILPSLHPLSRALGILHVLRCILGPLVESELLEERVGMVRKGLKQAKELEQGESMDYSSSLVPLFSQQGEAGSARNMAVVCIGSQGHLARALLDAVPKAGIQLGGVLALDGDGVIVEREREKMTKEGGAKEQNDGPRITHKIGRITSPQGLVDAVDEWIGEMEMESGSRDDQGKSKRANKPVIPVMLVSLWP